MRISKDRLREIVAEELKMSLKENKGPEVFELITHLLNEAKIKDSSLAETPKFKKILKAIEE